MALTVLDYATANAAGFPEQAGIDQVDFDTIVAGFDANYVVTGCGVTATGTTLVLTVAAGTIVNAGVIVGVTGNTITATADATNPRWALVSINASGTAVITMGTAAAASTPPVMPAVPAGNVLVAAVWVPNAVTALATANLVDKRIMRSAPLGMVSGSAAAASMMNIGRTALESTVGIDVAAGQFTDSAAGDRVARLVDTTKAFRWGHGSGAASKMVLSNTALTLPAGQAFTTGTRSVFTGTRATTTNASDTVDLGTFSTTGGAMELVLHCQLAAPAAGTTASITKVYEFAVSALLGTVSTWYKVLPVDLSANQAASNDFALEVQRTAAGTFQFRFRQITIGIAGVITFTVETLGDTAVTFTPSTTITAAPAAVTTLHPSNSFAVAAGNVGINTDAPAAPLTIAWPAASGTDLLSLTTSTTDGTNIFGNNGTQSWRLGNARTNTGIMFTNESAGDAHLQASANTLHVGVGSSGSTLKVTSSDVTINNGTPYLSMPRGRVVGNSTTTTVTAVSTTETAFSGLATTNLSVVVPGVISRRYRVNVKAAWTQTVAGDVLRLSIKDGGASAPTNASTELDFHRVSAGVTSGVSTSWFFEVTLTAGTHDLGLYGLRGAGTGTFTLGDTVNVSRVWVEDIGT